MKKTIVKPVDVEIYQCDGPGCEAQCEYANWPRVGTINTKTGHQDGCGWVEAIDWDMPKDPTQHHNEPIHGWSLWQKAATRYFCTWACLSRWAAGKAEANG